MHPLLGQRAIHLGVLLALLALIAGCGWRQPELGVEPLTATAMPTRTASLTPSPSACPTPSAAPTTTPTPTDTSTPTGTPTNTPTPLRSETPTITPTATPVEASLHITALRFKGPDEVVEITNLGGSDQDLSGWTLTSRGQKHPFRFPAGLVLPSGATVRVHSGPEAPESLPWDLRWSTDYLWNNSGDEAVLSDAAGQEIDRWSY